VRRKAIIVLAWLAAIVSMAAAARAQEGRSACKADHISIYNPDTYRYECLPLLKAGDKRTQALLKDQQQQATRLRREQYERVQNLGLQYELLRTEQQWRTQKLSRQARIPKE
jgi:hypothetical protein